MESRWQAPTVREYPASGHGVANPVRDVIEAPCQPACSLIEATTAALTIPIFSVTEQVGAAAVIDQARAAGIEAMWTAGTAEGPGRRYDLTEATAAELSPDPFGSDVALGKYPVTVLDQATAMATFAAGGRRRRPISSSGVSKDFASVYTPSLRSSCALSQAAVADVTWVLSQNAAGQLFRRPALGQPGRFGAARHQCSGHGTRVAGRLHGQPRHGGLGRQSGHRTSAPRQNSATESPASGYRRRSIGRSWTQHTTGSAYPSSSSRTRSSTATPPPATRGDMVDRLSVAVSGQGPRESWRERPSGLD